MNTQLYGDETEQGTPRLNIVLLEPQVARNPHGCCFQRLVSFTENLFLLA
jgi:hypothetical protein